MSLPIDSDAPAADLPGLTMNGPRPRSGRRNVPATFRMGATMPSSKVRAYTETTSSACPVVILETAHYHGPQAVNRVVTKNRVITDNTLGYHQRRPGKVWVADIRSLRSCPPAWRIGGSSRWPLISAPRTDGPISTSAGGPIEPARVVRTTYHSRHRSQVPVSKRDSSQSPLCGLC